MLIVVHDTCVMDTILQDSDHKVTFDNMYIALCRDPSTHHLDGYKPLWTGRNMGGQVKKNEGAKKEDIPKKT